MGWTDRYARAIVPYISYYKDTYAWIHNKNKNKTKIAFKGCLNYRAGTCIREEPSSHVSRDTGDSDSRSFWWSSPLPNKFQDNAFTNHHSFSHRLSTVWVAECRKTIHKKYVLVSSSILYQWTANRAMCRWPTKCTILINNFLFHRFFLLYMFRTNYRSNSFETCRARKNGGVKNYLRNCASRWSSTHCTVRTTSN